MTRTRGGLFAVLLALAGLALTALVPAGAGTSASAGTQARGAMAAVPAAVSGLGSFVVTPSDLGVHSNHTRPTAPTGAIRLNCFPTWREINPSKGVYVWGPMDAIVDRARSWGYKDVLHSFCGTPQWAAGPVREPDKEVLGYKSTAAPRNMADWEAYVTAVVKRYKGRITAYQAWNEGTTTQFFQGTPAQLAEMTKRLNTIVSKWDPRAVVVSASMQQVTSIQRSLSLKYLKELKRRGWPVEAYSFHGYGPKDTLANGRQASITSFRKQLASLSAPRRPIWDTETTFTGRPVTGEKAGALVIRSFLDAWRMGVKRTYWYIWFDGYNKFGSIQMRAGSVPAAALATFGNQVIGAKYNGCTEARSGLVRCSFTRAGKPFTIMWAEGKAVTVSRPSSTRYQNMATGAWSASKRISVKGSPLLVNARL